ncbi:hypothetical protein EXE63_13430 [Mycolicibacterium frederiksbergense]|uniref:Uncharacterized protein n=1 Tax=Mycolicibacterium frederiksbergense TaxID=117567 RepID=A0A6H0S530_9MYCO|nr:hypothetical protein EXE63_13430 [Mycolicibacterium frederiksbergense]
MYRRTLPTCGIRSSEARHWPKAARLRSRRHGVRAGYPAAAPHGARYIDPRATRGHRAKDPPGLGLTFVTSWRSTTGDSAVALRTTPSAATSRAPPVR